MKLDILVIAVHPDDAELGCAGTLIKHKKQGKKIGIIDLTRGELGSRGTAESRDQEAAAAAEILQLDVRENLGMRDGFFLNDEQHQMAVIQKIRQYRPDIIIANAIEDRHPDHPRAARLVNDAIFLSGLIKIKTQQAGKVQDPWRPRMLLHFIQSNYIKPDILIDISEVWDQKLSSILAYKSQFYNPEYQEEEVQTFISGEGFMRFIESKARELGKQIDATYAEGFTCSRVLGVDDLFVLK